jgi:acetylornithine/succinyldiaminopimelate/putrescine aminotransferase/predicted amino acid dehydrogenase/acyl carrier protein
MILRTEPELRAWVITYVRNAFNSSWDGAPASLADLGIDSLSGAELICALERWMGLAIPADFLTGITDTTSFIAALVALQTPVNTDPDARPYETFVNPYLAAKLRQMKIDMTFVRSEGAYMYDAEGRGYLDFLAQYGAVPFGHHPAEIWAALDALHADSEPVFAQPSMLVSAGLLAQRLVGLAPAGLRYVTLCNSGAEAVEAALKLARHATGRARIVSTHNGFHGKTFGALSATGKPDYQTHFGLPLPGFDHIEFGDAAALDACLTARPDEYAAFIVEPIQGEGGVLVPAPGYLHEVQAVCRRHDVLLIVDEVQTGLGRTGVMFMCNEQGVQPDIMTVSKALGGGLVPVGAMLATQAVYSEKFALKHSSTFAGNALGARAGLATLEVLTRDDNRLMHHVRTEGAYLKARLEEIRARHSWLIEEIRGTGFMLGIRFTTDRGHWGESFLGIAAEERELAQFVASYLLNVEGVRVAPTLNRGDVLRVQPPLTATREQCDMVADAIARVADVLAYRRTGLLYRAILRREAPTPRKLSPPSLPGRSELAPAPAGTHRFAFLLHPLDDQSYADYDTSLSILDASELNEFATSLDGLIDPVIGSTVDIESAKGVRARGDFIMLSHTAEQFRRLPQRDAVAVLKAGLRLALARGARIVGLGAYTSVVSGGGAQLLDAGVALTSGNSYTVVAGIEALDSAMQRAGRQWPESRACVVGAAGAIGACMAVLLARRTGQLVLVGNPAHEPAIGRARLLAVARTIVLQAAHPDDKADEPIHAGSVAAVIAGRIARGIAPDTVIQELEVSGALILTSQSSAIALADVGVTATSFPGKLVDDDMLRSGAILCDISRPRSFDASIVQRRPDVLVIDGGIIALPGKPRVGPYGIEHGTSYACMAETMLLALEGRFEHTSVGGTLDMSEISRQRRLARKHGFTLAGLQSFGRPLSDETWQRFIAATDEFSLISA